MSARILEDERCLDRLRADYEQAFDTWAHQVRCLQALIGSPRSLLLKETEVRVVAAERAYRLSRDRLTEGLVQAYGEASSCEDNGSSRAAL
jgi:hypothetical protein